jgi:ribosomal protein L35
MHQPTAKRFRLTKNGKEKLVCTRQGKSHPRRKKSKQVKRQVDGMIEVTSSGVKRQVACLATL